MSKDDDRLPAGLAQSTPETLAKALEDVLGPEFPRTIADRAVARIETTTSLWAGPVPDPRTLEEFEQILPGSADRLVVMAEKEQAYRHEIGRRRLAIITRGQWLGFAIGVLGLAGAVVVALSVDPWAGAALGGASLAAIVGAFLARRPHVGA